MFIEIKFKEPQTFQMNDRVLLLINGNLRPWIVVGWIADKTSIVFESTFGH